jgi:ABC-type multidrug transport system fused ATPase/permease subunit
MLLQEILSAKRIGAFIRSRDVDYLEETLPLSPLVSSSEEERQPLHIFGTVAWNLSEPFPAPDSHSDSAGIATPSFRLHGLNVQFPRGEMTLVAGKFGSGKTLLLLALMGEVRLVEGSISYAVSELLDPGTEDKGDWSLLKKRVAYVPQVSGDGHTRHKAVGLTWRRRRGYRV